MNDDNQSFICPVCGKTKYYYCDTEMWGYQIKNKKYCSYPCMRIAEKSTEKVRADHGIAKSRKKTNIYQVWQYMRKQVRESKEEVKPKIYEKWSSSYVFAIWAEQNGYGVDERRTLDRIDRKGDFTPTNCIFVTREERLQRR